MPRLPLPLLLILSFAACGASPAADRTEAPANAALAESFTGLGVPYSFTPPLPGTVCSGQMSEDQFARLPAAGIERVVSLRRPDEKGTGWEEARAHELGIEFVRIPIGGPDDLTRENAERLGAALSPPRPTLVACGSSNRVGALLALKAFYDGAPAEQALQLGKQAGLTKLEPVVRAKLGLP